MSDDFENDLQRNSLTGEGNLHSKNMVRALLWLMETQIMLEGDILSPERLAEAQDIIERLRGDVRLCEWQSRPFPVSGKAR
jgi:hypothetical protein